MKKPTTTTKEQLPVIQKEITPFVEQVNTMEIRSIEDMQGATEMLSRFNKYLDNLTDEKEALTKPLKDVVKEINARYKGTETILETVIAVMRKKMGNYQTALLAKQKEEADKIASRVGDGKGHIKIETAVKKIEALPTVNKKIGAESGSVSFTATRMFEVTDIAKLKPEFLLPNMPAIRQAMKDGNEMEGVKYWTEQVPVNRR